MKHYKSTTKESEKDLAQTPVWFVQSVETLFGFKFDLDVCALKTTAKAGSYFSLEEGVNGLSRPWSTYNWCNPPFSDILPWMRHAANDAKVVNAHTVLIYPDNPDTKYSRFAWDAADTIIRMPFRLQFLKPDGDPFVDTKGRKQSPQFPCALAYFSPIGHLKPTQCFYYDFRKGVVL